MEPRVVAAVIVRFEVTDPERWKRMYDTTARERAAVGISAALIFDDAENSNGMIVIYQVEDIKRAKAYLTMDRQANREYEVGVSDLEIWVGVER